MTTETDTRSQDRGTTAIKALRDAAGAKSLGDPAVVRKVLTDILEVVGTDPQGAVAAIQKATKILTGQDPAYATMGPWNSPDGGIGRWIRGHMNGVPADGGAEKAVEYALSHLALHQFDAIKGVSLGNEEPEHAGRRMRRMVVSWTALMLGLPAHLAQVAEAGGQAEAEADEGGKA